MAACLALRRGVRYSVFELLKDGTRIIRRFLKCIEYAVAHFDSGLESGFFTAVLTVRKVFGELIPLAANTESPPLEGCGLVRVAGDISLSHILIFFEVFMMLEHDRLLPDIISHRGCFSAI